MVQLDILNGQKAGTQWVARQFPFRLGRAPDSHVCLTDDGVWERHAEFQVDPEEGGILSPQPGAFTALNGFAIQQAVLLRNGDLIEVGSLQIRFGLSPTRPRSLRLRETLTWLGLGLVVLGQIALIYWFLD